MKRSLKILIVLLVGFFFNISSCYAKEKVTLYFFHGDGCPHCAEEEKYLDTLEDKYDNLKIKEYEVWYDFNNKRLMNDVAKELGTEVSGVPFTVIGEDYFKGYSEASNSEFENSIEKNSNGNYTDVVSLVKKGKSRELKSNKERKEKKKTDTMISMPFVGKINVSKLSIPLAAVVIGLVDGFNPCAMWVLLFLISTLIGMKNRKRMWILGLSFLITSALMYLVVMFSIFNITTSISTSIFLRNLIALVAVVLGIVNLYNYFKANESGCEVVDDNKRKKIFARIKKFTAEKSLWLALGGVIALAISVNLIELACSAGLPLVFTELLTLNKVPAFLSFIYTLIYILFFLIDDIIIFAIAMTTMKLSGISTKYSKYSHLIGGILLLIIGILLIFKPGWLMFNFS